MRKTTRLGLIVLLIGLALFFTGILRSSPQTGPTYSWFLGDTSSEWGCNDAKSCFWPARDLRLDVNLNTTVNLFILNGEEFQLWNQTEELKPTAALYNIKQGTYSIEVKERGEYMLIIQNFNEESFRGEISIDIFGIERDLLWASTGCIITGLAITMSTLIIAHAKLSFKK